MKRKSTFARRLAELRTAAGLSQYRLAQLCDLSRQAVSQLELGTMGPSWPTVQRLAAVLKCSTEDLRTERPLE